MNIKIENTSNTKNLWVSFKNNCTPSESQGDLTFGSKKSRNELIPLKSGETKTTYIDSPNGCGSLKIYDDHRKVLWEGYVPNSKDVIKIDTSYDSDGNSTIDVKYDGISIPSSLKSKCKKGCKCDIYLCLIIILLLLIIALLYKLWHS
jgi:hypothetical protein